MAEFKSIHTTVGLAALAAEASGIPINITHMAVAELVLLATPPTSHHQPQPFQIANQELAWQ